MGTNYYLHYKKPYEPKDTDFCEYDCEVDELTNGLVWKNTYYQNIDELNKDYYLELHIGKSSFGWHFGLCIYPELGINTFEDWCKLFDQFEIWNEYDEIVTKEDMVITISNRKTKYPSTATKEEVEKWEKEFIEDQNSLDGYLWHNRVYRDYDDYLASNHAARGIGGLLKHNYGDYLEYTTDGTYDYTTDWRFS